MKKGTLAQQLWDEYIGKYETEIYKLRKIKELIKDNSVHGRPLDSHIMFKVNLGTTKEENSKLDVKDRIYKYEFLIEFDKKTPGYGIYYGCRAVADSTLSKKQFEEQIDLIAKEWEYEIKEDVQNVLNKVFTGSKKFHDSTFRKTNNTNENTYWPFWITLYDEEDIIEVAARAIKLIANIYYRHQYKNSSLFKEVSLEKELNKNHKQRESTKTIHTIAAFHDVIAKELKEEKTKILLNFIKEAENNGDITRNKDYELCWDINKKENTKKQDFAKKYYNKCKELGYSENKIPWRFANILFSQNLKSSYEAYIAAIK